MTTAAAEVNWKNKSISGLRVQQAEIAFLIT